MLPKIHKPNSPGRPIVSACCCPTENIAAYLDEVMAPLVSCLPTYVKDTNDALRIFDTFTFDSSNDNPRFLFTMDIKSLYTVIPNNGGLQALSYFFDQRANKEPPTHTLTRLAELVLTLTPSRSRGNTIVRSVASPWGARWVLVTLVCTWAILKSRFVRVILASSHSCSNVTLMTLLDARSALATIWSSTSITYMYLTSIQLSSSHQPTANWNCRFSISNWVLTVRSYRHRCTTRKLIRITTSITRHSILITARGQFHTVSFFDSAGSALTILISRTKPQRWRNTSGRVVILMNLSTTISEMSSPRVPRFSNQHQQAMMIALIPKSRWY